MARTHNTMKGRKMRQLKKAYSKAFNEGTDANLVRKQAIDLNGSSMRYGNKRKAMAETKVMGRRAERQRLNSKTDQE